MLGDAVRALLDAEGWVYAETPDGTAFDFAIEANNGRYDCRATASDATAIVVFRALAPDAAPPDRVDEVVELAVRANAELALGSFDVDYDSGRISFRIGADTSATPPTPELLQSLAYTAVLTMDRHAVALWRVLHAGVSASEALATAPGR